MYFCNYVGLVFVVCWNSVLMHMSIDFVYCGHFSVVFSTFIWLLGALSQTPTNVLSLAPARCTKDPSFVPHSSYISSV